MLAQSPQSSECFPNMETTLNKKITGAMLAQSAQIFTRKPAVSNMYGGLHFNRVQHHRIILAFFVQCWLECSFTACGTTMNKGRH